MKNAEARLTGIMLVFLTITISCIGRPENNTEANDALVSDPVRTDSGEDYTSPWTDKYDSLLKDTFPAVFNGRGVGWTVIREYIFCRISGKGLQFTFQEENGGQLELGLPADPKWLQVSIPDELFNGGISKDSSSCGNPEMIGRLFRIVIDSTGGLLGIVGPL